MLTNLKKFLLSPFLTAEQKEAEIERRIDALKTELGINKVEKELIDIRANQAQLIQNITVAGDKIFKEIRSLKCATKEIKRDNTAMRQELAEVRRNSRFRGQASTDIFKIIEEDKREQ